MRKKISTSKRYTRKYDLLFVPMWKPRHFLGDGKGYINSDEEMDCERFKN
jgi:hypothetical protein